LNRDSTEDALRVIQRACQRFPDDPRLHATLESVRERVQQEKTDRLKKACLQKAKEEIGRGDYDAALLTLEIAQAQLTGDSEVDDLLQQVRSRATQATKEKRVETACAQGQRLLQDGEFERAVTLLERSVAEFPDPRLESLREEAKAKAEAFNGAANTAAQQAQRMLQEGKVEETLTFLLEQPGSYGRVQSFADTCEQARLQHERTVTSVPRQVPVTAKPESATNIPEEAATVEPQIAPVETPTHPIPEAKSPPPAAAGRPAAEKPLPSSESPRARASAAIPAPARPQTSKGMLYGMIAGILVLLAIAAALLLHHRSAAPSASTTLSGPGPDAYVEVIAQPWATVKSLTGTDGKVLAVGELTPVRVRVPAGNYTITLTGPNSQEHTDQISVTSGSPAQYSYTFEAVDAAKIVNAY
jgi:tetratricopeptide (TPR) repeat protein